MNKTFTQTIYRTAALILFFGTAINSYGHVAGCVKGAIPKLSAIIIANPRNSIMSEPILTKHLPSPSSTDTLSNLTISNGMLNPSFSGYITSYTTSVNVLKKSHLVYTMGDSITGLDEYPPVLDSLLGYVYNFVNFGIKGDFTWNMVNRFQPVINAAPDYVIILGGTNDIGASGLSAISVENNLQNMYTRAHNAGIKVIALTITPFKGSVNWSPYKQTVTDSVNAWIPTAINVDNVIDTYNGLLDPANPYQMLPIYDDGDHLHPSEAGMTKMADMIYAGVTFVPNPLVDQYNLANSTVTVTPTLSDPAATVTVNGQAVSFGGSSGNIPLAVGSNQIVTAVTSSDGTQTQNYNINITGKPSTNAGLANLYVNRSDYHLAPLFSPGILNYATTVNYDTTAVTVRAYPLDYTAKITINGVFAAPGVLSAPINLNIGLNNILIVCTAQDGITTQTYTMTINRLDNSNDDLLNIGLGNGLTLTPAFSNAELDYSVKIPSSESSITITPVKSDSAARVTVGHQVVATGSSITIPLTVANSTDSITVVAADNVTKRLFKIATVWEITNANLSGLSINGATLSKSFSQSVLTYTATTPNTAITVTPTAADSTSTIQVNGLLVATGSASALIALVPGANIINVVVTAKDGKTTKTYSVTVTSSPVSNATLSTLVTSATLSPAFSPTVNSYKVSVANSVTSLNVQATGGSNVTGITLNGATLAAGSSASVPLNVGTDTVTIISTAQGTANTDTYTIIATRAASSNTNLSSLSLSSGSLSPVFSASVTSYTVAVANTVDSITVKPSVSAVNGSTIMVNGIATASGASSQKIPLAIGSNTIMVEVIAQNGINTKNYTITVTRPENATLSSLVTSGTLLPAFSPTVNSYKISAANSVTSLNVQPTAGSSLATITLNGSSIASDSLVKGIPLIVGANTITIVVTAQDGVTTNTYTIIATRAASSNTNLSSLSLSGGALSPTFNASVTAYTVSVANPVDTITVKPSVSATNGSAITVNGIATVSGASSQKIPLAIGSNTIMVEVIAQNGINTKNYTITVTRPANATLSSLVTSGTLLPAFLPTVNSYKISTANSVTSLNVQPTAGSSLATITLNGSSIASDSLITGIPLVVGANTITIVVTAQDGVTTNTYTIIATRAASSNTNLSSLILSSGGLSPTFSASVTSYTVTVANTADSITVKPSVSAVNGSTIMVNGAAIVSGSVSQSIPLVIGTNAITVEVTAQNNINTKNYTITVTRPANTGMNAFIPIPNNIMASTDSMLLMDDGVKVHELVSPNGDGINDFLKIDGITAYTDNKLVIVNLSGAVIYEAESYDNNSRVFDGHSNKNGRMQYPGTYFYLLDYTVKGIKKHKSGYFVLKY